MARPDGVHVRVVSDLDEPASVNGLGMDVEQGASDWVLGLAQGPTNVACWPFSKHGGEEPPTTRLLVHDPRALWVSGELDCQGGEAWSQIADFAHAPRDDEPTLEEARGAIEGLRDDDELRFAGYPEDPGSVLVIRHGCVVGSFGLVRFRDDGAWGVAGATACADAGFRY